jgi:hypothetical protein
MFQLQLFFLLHCDEWDRVVALPRHKFVTGATLLQLACYQRYICFLCFQIVRPEMTKFKMFREFSKHEFLFCGNYILKYW